MTESGTEAVEVIDQHTLEYYKTILNLTIKADSAEIAALDLMDKLIILRVRDLMTPQEVLSMDGKSFFVYAVDHGMIGKQSVDNLELGTIELEGETAKGQVVANGQPVPIYFSFHNEQGNWKIDLTSIFDVSQAALQTAISG